MAALGPKVILSAGVRPALKRAGRARHSGYDHSFTDGSAWFRFSFVWPDPTTDGPPSRAGMQSYRIEDGDSAAAIRLGMERPGCARALDEPASRKVGQVSKAPQLAASLPARPIQPIQDHCRSRRDERIVIIQSRRESFFIFPTLKWPPQLAASFIARANSR